MIHDGRVKGLPLVQYSDTKANIAALSLTAADAGAEAYATDTGEKGVYSGSAWVWGKLTDITTATIHAATAKSTPVDADETALLDSAASYGLKKLTWAAIKATLKTYFDTLYNLYVHPNHTGDVTSAGDGATMIANKQTLTAALPVTISNSPTVIAGAAPVIAVNAASEAAVGVVERATDAEAFAMTDTERYVTPSQLGKYGVSDQLFGSGWTGAATISTDTTLTGDMYYSDLTVDTGVNLNTGGYRIFVKGTLTLNGTIRNIGGNGGDGFAPDGGAAGAASAAGSTKASPAGVVGGAGAASNDLPASGSAGTAGTNESVSDGGSSGVVGGAGGGYSGASGSGAGGAAGATTNASAAYGDIHNVLMGIMWRLFTTTGLVIPGRHAGNGSGGGGGADGDGSSTCYGGGGGGSGGNGGFVILVARKITGSGTVSAAGGNGGNGGDGYGAGGNAGGGGGGAGGSGGVIILVCLDKSSITLNVAGGTGGAGGAPLGSGSAGSAGTNGRNGAAIQF